MSSDNDTLRTQALIITEGPFAGRICSNDDDDFVLRSDMKKLEVRLYDKLGLKWRKPEYDADEEPASDLEIGLDCEIVTFGFYLQSKGTYCIPREILRPATMKDLIERFEQISDIMTKFAFGFETTHSSAKLRDLLVEKELIFAEIVDRDSRAKFTSLEQKKIFLCHASADKWFVRRVRSDLASAGHATWIDEWEIKVGDSIVDKVSGATEKADALILFVSKASNQSEWVKREWQSALSRRMATGAIRVLPVLIEDCSIPAIMHDVKYADFRESYNHGLEELLRSVA